MTLLELNSQENNINTPTILLVDDNNIVAGVVDDVEPEMDAPGVRAARAVHPEGAHGLLSGRGHDGPLQALLRGDRPSDQ